MRAAQDLSFWIDAKRVLRAWPAHLPLIYLGGVGSSQQALALAAEAVSWEDFASLPVCPAPAADSQVMVAAIPYWNSFRKPAGPADSMIWRITAMLNFDHAAQKLRVWGDAPAPILAWLQDLAKAEPPQEASLPTERAPMSLLAETDDASYLAQVAAVRDDIRRGRYYQVNLLRYFSLATLPSPAWLATRLTRLGGPFSAWLRTPSQELVSFSPERFVEVDGKGHIHAYPIKGTAARSPDPAADAHAAAQLMTSAKDRAELAMIVDLMRHDLAGICRPSHIQAMLEPQLRSSATVHHLEGHVWGQLAPDLTWADFLRVLLPAGSITGAPKVEVMEAIAAMEGQERGYFMGNLFYLHGRQVSSSVLIRSLWRQAETWRYAAGSGLVLDSEPAWERDEVTLKCRILTTALAAEKAGEV